MTKRDARWERIRAKGKWPFIFKFGVLFWGVLTPLCLRQEGVRC